MADDRNHTPQISPADPDDFSDLVKTYPELKKFEGTSTSGTLSAIDESNRNVEEYLEKANAEQQAVNIEYHQHLLKNNINSMLFKYKGDPALARFLQDQAGRWKKNEKEVQKVSAAKARSPNETTYKYDPEKARRRMGPASGAAMPSLGQSNRHLPNLGPSSGPKIV
jgi:hypothetical protein